MIGTRSGRRRIGLVVAGAVLVGLFLLVALNGRSGGLENRLAAYRAAGIPVTFDELERGYVEVPDSENEALKVEEAVGGWLHLGPTNLLDGKFPDRLVRDDASWVGVELSRNAGSLERLHSVTESARGRFRIVRTTGDERVNRMHTCWHWIEGGVGMMKVEARVECLRGNPARASRALISGLRVLRMGERIPVVSRVWEQARLRDELLVELEKVLSGPPMEPPALEAMAHEMSLQEASLGMPSAVRDLRCEILDRFRRNWEGAWENAGAIGGTPGLFERSVFALYKGAGIPRRDLGRVLAALDEFEARVEGPPERFFAIEPRRLSESGVPGALNHLFSIQETQHRQLMHALWEQQVRSVAGIRCAVTALAIERWRLGHGGALPERLEQLVPGLLPSIPVRPIDGGSLQYLPARSGYGLECSTGDPVRGPIHFIVKFQPR